MQSRAAYAKAELDANEANMNSSLVGNCAASKCIHRVEAQDENLRHLRFKVEVHAAQLLKSRGREREQEYQLYKQAMRRLLSYLETHFVE